MRRLILTFILILSCALGAVAQSHDDLIQKAYLLYTERNLKEASETIDQAIQTKKGAQSSLAWHIRGFIYKDLYTSAKPRDRKSEDRIKAVSSFETSMGFDENEEFLETNEKALDYLAKSYWNDASDIIDERDKNTVDASLEYYNEFKRLYTLVHPDSSIVPKDVKVNLALATAHRKIYEKDRKANEAHWGISNKYLLEVLALDPKNWDANYSLGVSYYNRGAFGLEKLPNVEAIVDLYRLQGESMQSIQGALPFMLKAYEIDPERIEAVKGLKWITFNLHQYDESSKYDEKLNSKKP